MADRPTPQDVLLALLALDSYSRGENAQILDKDGNPLAKTIGTATWNRDSPKNSRDPRLPKLHGSSSPTLGF
jgi:hypothetical protein